MWRDVRTLNGRDRRLSMRTIIRSSLFLLVAVVAATSRAQIQEDYETVPLLPQRINVLVTGLRDIVEHAIYDKYDAIQGFATQDHRVNTSRGTVREIVIRIYRNKFYERP